MPPKKVSVDKTFGMKNKNKSAKVQQQVATIKQQEARRGKNPDELKKEEEKAAAAKAKADEAKRLKAQMELFKPAQAQKVPFGVDPKTVVCQYFAAGFCEKGKKCRLSHDLNVGRKVEKRNVYSDDRAGAANPGDVNPDDKTKDTMDTWDDEKLKKVVLSKYGNPKTTTDIVCKFFIQAIEDQKYGWFWECPNGVNCFYRHALPPGYVLNSEKKKKAEADKANVITLEEFLESERHKLGKNLTPVTAETFAIWKKTRLDKKTAEEDAANKLKNIAGNSGKTTGMSGRDLFTFNPNWFQDEEVEEEDQEEWDLAQYRQEDSEDEDAAASESGGKTASEVTVGVSALSVSEQPENGREGAVAQDG
ncbi:Uncharacterized conserved protein, contains CCCH-type Zn-finger [Phaffia rhodozyma]|uniref:Uncharacterized conserved protein, contains CCCH-type Zn-finger n=1 Tax=Phaffia rhodozyma TaxID=264483 RepID=A0A0F7SX24_PHARH|nr:Uncharacterized conserved protein, contains CCCH-type Zn-finger [Phaffia rhodozyma]